MNTQGFIKIKQIRGVICTTEKQRANMRGLGLGRRESIVFRQDTPAIRGMISKVLHLVQVQKVRELPKQLAPRAKDFEVIGQKSSSEIPSASVRPRKKASQAKKES